MTFLLFPREQEEPSTRSRGMGVDRSQHPRAQQVRERSQGMPPSDLTWINYRVLS